MMKLKYLATMVATVLVLAPAALAQGTGPAAEGGKGLLAIAAAFGMGIAAFGCGMGQGRVGAAACEGIARNPAAAGVIRAAMILGLVFVETLAIFTLVVVFVKF